MLLYRLCRIAVLALRVINSLPDLQHRTDIAQLFHLPFFYLIILLVDTSKAFPSRLVPLFFLASKNDREAYNRVSYLLLLLLIDLFNEPYDGARLCVLSNALGCPIEGLKIFDLGCGNLITRERIILLRLFILSVF